MIDTLIGGVATGSLYAILAVGFVMVYSATGVANFAQGSLAMVAAFVMFTASVNWGIPVWPAALFGLASAVLVSCVTYYLGLRFIQISDPLYKGIATLAIDTILVNGARAIWGPSSFQFNSLLRTDTFAIGGLTLPTSYAITFLVALCVAFLLQMFLTLTRTGIVMRAVTQNAEIAVMMGVKLTMISLISWALCGVLAGIAGLLLAPVAYLSYNMMTPYLIRMFAAAALGGLTSLWGAVTGGLLLGAIEGLVGRFVSATMIDVVSVLLLLCVLIFRPQGLFGSAPMRRV